MCVASNQYTLGCLRNSGLQRL